MLNKCLYLRVRHNKGQLYLFCTKTREIVQKGCYIGCLEKEYKKPKPINKVSKKRITVSRGTYEQVFLRDKGTCRMRDEKCKGKIEAHHILYRSQRKDLIDEPSNLILLCTYHHKLVHSNKKKYQPMLLEMIKEEK